jgi:hypothetical protein
LLEVQQVKGRRENGIIVENWWISNESHQIPRYMTTLWLPISSKMLEGRDFQLGHYCVLPKSFLSE